MSDLSQPILIANGGYHVGHQMSIRVAEEQGYFADEGLKEYEYDWKGLIPGPLEAEGLGLVMEEHGVDVAPSINLESAVRQRLKGEDLYIVAAWRQTPRGQFVGARGMTGLADLRGKRVGIRETGGLGYRVIANALIQAGIDPSSEVTWVCDRRFAYGNSPEIGDLLRSGQLEAMSAHGPLCEKLQGEGYPLLLDTKQIYPGGRPGRVIVATGRTIEQRGAELRAFLRANMRAYWFIRNAEHYEYLADLEKRLRRLSHNENERNLQIVSNAERLEGWVMPVKAPIPRDAMARVIGEMVAVGELGQPMPVEEVMRDEAAVEAYGELAARPSLQAEHQRALELVARHGF
jgi:ABC-type nitrate/sulfonate/bicarbonate transport system substrate-binding protein